MLEIYYFSGTGNSLFVAKELQRRIPGTQLIPIAALLHQKNVRAGADAVGFIFPVHALTLPIAVKKFLKKLDISKSDYTFAVATREGTIFRGFEAIDRIIKKRNKKLNAAFVLNMCNNEARHPGYKVPAEEDIQRIEENVLVKLNTIAQVIALRKDSREKDTEYTVDVAPALEKTVLAGMALAERIGGVQYFYADQSCKGCGICEKVCLSGKIKLKDKKPVWQWRVFCTMCFACLNFCPSRSVQIKDIPGVKSGSKENGRYPHPYASVNDIAMQKKYDRQEAAHEI